MAFNSNGAVSFEYLINSNIVIVKEINQTLKEIEQSINNGK